MTKLTRCDLTSSNDDFTSNAQSIKLISTTSTTHPVNNETLGYYPEGLTLSKFIYEGRSTTTKPTFIALPYLTSHSTFYECLRGILCQPQYSPHSPLTKTGVIIPYSIRLERRITSPSIYIIRWNITKESIPKKSIYLTSRKTTTFLPYQIDVKVTCTGVYVYVEIIYIDSSPDPDILAPYIYSDPSDETIRRLYGIPSEENYISDH